MVHYSKKDWWLCGAVCAAVLIPLVVGAFLWLAGGPGLEAGRVLLIIGATTGAVVLLLTYPLYYEVTASELKIRCGMFMRRLIPLSSVEGVRPDSNPSSAPAWSLDRLRVDYRKGDGPAFVLISPEDQLAFMRDLAGADAGLKMKGNRLERESKA